MTDPNEGTGSRPVPILGNDYRRRPGIGHLAIIAGVGYKRYAPGFGILEPGQAGNYRDTVTFQDSVQPLSNLLYGQAHG
jgi:hypothetical protein